MTFAGSQRVQATKRGKRSVRDVQINKRKVKKTWAGWKVVGSNQFADKRFHEIFAKVHLLHNIAILYIKHVRDA